MSNITKNALALLGVAGFIGYKAIERFPEYLGPLVALTSVETIKGSVTHIRDGDTIEVNDIPIRFGSLDCAETGTTAGSAATTAIAQLTTGAELTCYLNGRSSYERRIGSCQMADGTDLGGLMINGGHCERFW